MIVPETGKFRLDGTELVIHPELNASEFLCANIPLLEPPYSNKEGWTTCRFIGFIDGMEAEFLISFRWQKLCKLIWRPRFGGQENAWEEMSLEAQKKYLNKWLNDVIGVPPPYEYEWGCLGARSEIHSGTYSIFVEFKYGLLDRGITDFKAYYEERRSTN